VKTLPTFSLDIYCVYAAIHGKEHSGTKKQVGNRLALNLVSQLYKMGAIEPCKVQSKKKDNQVCRVGYGSRDSKVVLWFSVSVLNCKLIDGCEIHTEFGSLGALRYVVLLGIMRVGVKYMMAI